MPLEMACWIMSSRLSCAWLGQNCPEWLCIEKAILAGLMYEDVEFEVRQEVIYFDKGILGYAHYRRLNGIEWSGVKETVGQVSCLIG
jgi:hypothetical protein